MSAASSNAAFFYFGFTLINGIWTALEMLLLSALGLIVFMGFGFVVSGIAKSENVIPPIANIITLPQFLLCGTGARSCSPSGGSSASPAPSRGGCPACGGGTR